MRRILPGIWTIVAFFCMNATGLHAATIEVFVSILPQAYFVERIGGSLVHVDVLVGPGQSPATYEPSPRQMADLGNAALYFRIGTTFEEGFIDTIARNFPRLRIVDTRKNIALLYFGEKEQGGRADPHIWLDPVRVRIQARTICDALADVDPKHADRYRKNLAGFEEDLDNLHKKITKILKPLRGRTLYVFHPAFGYFAHTYGLRQVAVETGGKEPSPKQLARLIDGARKDGVKVIFVQPQFSRRYAAVIAREIGGVVVPMDPLPQQYMQNLQDMAEAIRSALTQEKEKALQPVGGDRS